MPINKHRSYRQITHEHFLFCAALILAAVLYSGRVWHTLSLASLSLIALSILILLIISLLARQKSRRNKNHLKQRVKPALSRADRMDGVSFERVVADLLRSRGFHRIKLTEHYDFGIDIIAERGGIRWGVQVKRHTRLVKLSAVSQAVAALAHYNCDRAMVITNGRFSASARTLAASNNCLLIDGPHLRYWARLRNT